MSAGSDLHRAGRARRSFLLTLAAGAAGGILYVAGGYRAVFAEPIARQWSNWLLDAYNREAVVRLGNAYRLAQTAERDAGVLADYIDKALVAVAGAGIAANENPADIAAAAQRRIRAEYAKGEVVRVAGWVLSITEARLYALVAAECAERGEPETGCGNKVPLC